MQNFWDFWAKNWTKWFSQVSFGANFTPLRDRILQRPKQMVTGRRPVDVSKLLVDVAKLSQFLPSHLKICVV